MKKGKATYIGIYIGISMHATDGYMNNLVE